MAPVNLYPDLASKVPSTLLVVDDDEMNRCILGNIFAPYYSIQEAADGKEGLEMILAQPENLCAVLLDVMMPEMDGIRRAAPPAGVFDYCGGQRQRDERGL